MCVCVCVRVWGAMGGNGLMVAVVAVVVAVAVAVAVWLAVVLAAVVAVWLVLTYRFDEPDQDSVVPEPRPVLLA